MFQTGLAHLTRPIVPIVDRSLWSDLEQWQQRPAEFNLTSRQTGLVDQANVDALNDAFTS
jgi:hypothetical protein